MKSVTSLEVYLKKRAISSPWKLSKTPKKKYRISIVIPAYNELDSLFITLNSINKNNIDLLLSTIVVVVINNSEKTPNTFKINNLLTIKQIQKSKFYFNLLFIDASSKGLELPEKYAGVGLARKIGIDLILPYMLSKKSLIFCTDADVTVSPDYLLSVSNYFTNNKSSAAVIGFKHRKANIELIDSEIQIYENYLKDTAKQLKKAGSPYSYVSMGSTMVCTLEAYCAVGGMPKKKATEDFYFLQALSKFCSVESINKELIFPSSRPISRVHLGTGFRMKQVQNGLRISSLYFDENAFEYLAQWISTVKNCWDLNIVSLLSKTNKIHPQFNTFIIEEGINRVWKKLQQNSKSRKQFINQFHRWFDGLKTIKLLKYFTN